MEPLRDRFLESCPLSETWVCSRAARDLHAFLLVHILNLQLKLSGCEGYLSLTFPCVVRRHTDRQTGRHFRIIPTYSMLPTLALCLGWSRASDRGWLLLPACCLFYHTKWRHNDGGSIATFKCKDYGPREQAGSSLYCKLTEPALDFRDLSQDYARNISPF